jgi:hypothetical protein
LLQKTESGTAVTSSAQYCNVAIELVIDFGDHHALHRAAPCNDRRDQNSSKHRTLNIVSLFVDTRHLRKRPSSKEDVVAFLVCTGGTRQQQHRSSFAEFCALIILYRLMVESVVFSP